MTKETLEQVVERLRKEQQSKCGDAQYHGGYDAALKDVLAADPKDIDKTVRAFMLRTMNNLSQLKGVTKALSLVGLDKAAAAVEEQRTNIEFDMQHLLVGQLGVSLNEKD